MGEPSNPAGDRNVAAADGLPMPRRVLAVAAITFGNIITSIDAVISNVALPAIAKALHVEDASTVVIVTAYQLVLLTTLLPLSSLGDRLGHRRMFVLGQTLFALATAGCLLVDDLPTLIAMRCLQAVASAASLSVSSALLRETYPAGMLGRGLGFNSLAVTASLAATPAVSGLILAFAHWRWLFAAELPLAVATLLFVPALPARGGRREPYDLRSAALCMATFGLIGGGVDALVHSPTPLWPMLAIVAGALPGAALLKRSLAAERPMFPVDLLRDRMIGLTALGLIGAYAAAMLLALSTPFRLAHGFHLDAVAVGAAMTGWPVGMMIGSPLGGVLSDRYAPARLGAMGVAASVAAMVLAAVLPDLWGGPLTLAWTIGLCAAAFGFCYAVSVRLMLSTPPRSRVAAAGSLVATVRCGGQLLGATATAALLAAGAGDGGKPLLIGAALACVSLAIFLQRAPTRVAAVDAA